MRKQLIAMMAYPLVEGPCGHNIYWMVHILILASTIIIANKTISDIYHHEQQQQQREMGPQPSIDRGATAKGRRKSTGSTCHEREREEISTTFNIKQVNY